MSLARKIALMITVPLIAVVAYAAVALYGTVSQAVSATELKNEVALAGTASKVIQNLHRERIASLDLLVPDPPESQKGEFRTLAADTDKLVAQYRSDRGALSAPPENLTAVLDRIDGGLNDLPGLRDQVLNGGNTNLSTITFRYRILAADLVTYRSDVATGAPLEVANRIRTAALLSQISEDVGLEEIAVLRVPREGFTPAAAQDVQADRSDLAEAAREFSQIAPAEWQAWYDKARVGAAAQTSQIIEDEVARTVPGVQPQFSARSWRAAMDSRIASLGQVERQADDAVLAAVVDYRNHQLLLTAVLAAAVLVTLVIAIIIAVRLGTPMLRGLRRLRTAAHLVAYERLPAAVAALSKRNALGSASPEEFAERQGDAVRIAGADEIAQVGAAFNEMNQSALHLAAQQAVLRDQVDAIFVALARRAELLTSSLIAQVDSVEHGEEDPDRLAQLFKLDNLATRMRRTNNSLLVLGGEASARVSADVMTVYDLLNAATAQVERYTQVDIRSDVDVEDVDDGELVLAPEVTDHLAHLIAELIDNATTYSSPGSRVLVRARLVEDRVVVTIADRGIGFEPDALAAANARLAGPTLDLSTVRTMGLTVVGQIAAWYGVRVRLRTVTAATPAESGTVATVSLPGTVFRRNDPDFDWFTERERAMQAAREAPRPGPSVDTDRRNPAKISGVMTAFARGIGAHRTAGAGPDSGDGNLVEHM